MIVTTRHLFTIPGYTTRHGFCRDQSKAWAKRLGLDWKAFVRDGIDSEALIATGNGFAIALVDWARQCAAATEGKAHG